MAGLSRLARLRWRLLGYVFERTVPCPADGSTVMRLGEGLGICLYCNGYVSWTARGSTSIDYLVAGGRDVAGVPAQPAHDGPDAPARSAARTDAGWPSWMDALVAVPDPGKPDRCANCGAPLELVYEGGAMQWMHVDGSGLC